MKLVFPGLYQFSSYIQPFDLSLHQYLLLADDPVLVHTGNTRQTALIVPQIRKLLAGRPLRFIFASHFESDECGGVGIAASAFPEASVICSSITAREIAGFGLSIPTLIKNGGDSFKIDGGDFLCIAYPSECHLWDGLVLFERTRGIFFSSDLFFRFGESHGKVIDGEWNREVEAIDQTRVPNTEKLNLLKTELLRISPAFVATGHGSCIRTTLPKSEC